MGGVVQRAWPNPSASRLHGESGDDAVTHDVGGNVMIGNVAHGAFAYKSSY